MTSLDTVRLLRKVGFLLWAVVGAPALARLAQDVARVREPGWLAWVLAYLVWIAAFAVVTRPREEPQPWALPLLALQSASALVLSASSRGLAEPALLVGVAGQLPHCLPVRLGLVWVAAQSVALTLLVAGERPPLLALAVGASWATFQLFAFAAAHLAALERRSREELQRVNADLLATRELLAETSRLGERLRIARDLHDTLGHHLTALSLNLEAAAHAPAERAREPLERAQALTRLLLAEVRQVVSDVREDPVDVARALQALAAGVSEPRIHLTLPSGLELRDPAQAQATFRCVQEIVTNAVRHAQAKNLWIELLHTAEGLEVKAHDDGRGTAEVEPGLGLTGMRERLEQAGGRLELASAPGRGFELRAVLPLS